MDLLVRVALLFLLILLNGFFVATEFALIAVRKTRIDELVKKRNKAAKAVQQALSDIEQYISSVQIGVTITSLTLGWFGEPFVAAIIEPDLRFLPRAMVATASHTISAIIAFIIITYLQILFGELIPKNIARQQSERVALLFIVPLRIFTRIFHPFIWFLNASSRFILRLFGFQSQSSEQMAYSEDEIKMILSQSSESGIIPKKEVEMVYSVFRLGDLTIDRIMVPRTEIVAFSDDTTLKQVVQNIMQLTQSRYPVYRESIDDIIGFIHIKDIYKEALDAHADKKLRETDLIRDILTIPETKKADKVLLDMRRRQVHMAVALDEYGGTAGILTLEDIIEGVVGEIFDEFESPNKGILKQKDGSFIIDGGTPLEEIQQRFDLVIKGQGYATVGGLVFGLLGREPQKGDSVQINNITLEVILMDGKRIEQIRLSKSKKN